MLNCIQLLLVRFSAVDGGLEKLECSTGRTGFRNRSGSLSFVTGELCRSSIWIVGLCRHRARHSQC